MNYGNITVAVGDCPVCGRVGVNLHEYRDYKGHVRRACTDEFACAEAWAKRRFATT